MIFVDSSVWIAFFRGDTRRQTDELHDLLASEPLIIGDIILMEILQSFRRDADYDRARRLLGSLELKQLCGREVALSAAENYRSLRRRGITIGKSIDMIVGTWCLINNAELLHADRDFDALEDHLGLRVYRG